MDSRIASTPPPRPDAVTVESAPRPTPTPVRVKFSDVLAGGAAGLVRGAEVAMRSLPGSPLMAVSVRGSSGAAVSAGGVASASGLRASVSPEGPGGVGATASAGGVGVGIGGAGVGTGAAGAPADGGVEQTLQQSAEMNLYYLQLQEQVNAENRTYSALSNVLKAEHDTVKNAIGNLR